MCGQREAAKIQRNDCPHVQGHRTLSLISHTHAQKIVKLEVA